MPYVGGVTAYKKKCDEVAANGYAGFRLGVLAMVRQLRWPVRDSQMAGRTGRRAGVTQP
jgi:hypothetical protein